MPQGMNWIVAVPRRRSCELPCSILAASAGLLESKRNRHVATLPCESSAQPDEEPRPVVCQYRAHLRGNFSLDRFLSTDGGGDAATCRVGGLPACAPGRRPSQLCLVLSRSGHARDDHGF